MKMLYFLYWFLIISLILSACTSSPSPTSTSVLQATPDPHSDSETEGTYPTLISSNSSKLPVTWTNLNLSGQLVYSLGSLDKNNNLIVQLQALDLLTGNVTVLYNVVQDGWIYYASVSPDGTQIIMSYSPPLQSDPNVVQALYRLPMDHPDTPQLLLKPPVREDQYTQVEWSADGTYLYYTYVNYVNPSDSNRAYPLYKIFRMKYPGGEPQLVAEDAYWPRLSPDGSRLVYVSLDPSSAEQHLKIADPDGSHSQELVLSGPNIPHDKSSPFFSADGKSIIFGGNVAGESAQPNWFANILGIQSAKAEGKPSDWFSVSLSGGEITQLTHRGTPYLYGSLSPDRKHIVSYGGDDLSIMNPDGSGLTILVSGLHSFYGTVSWIP